MDPYLEGSEWTSVHNVFAVEIARQLTPLLVPRYVARTGKRYVVTTLESDDDVGISNVRPDDSFEERQTASQLPMAEPTIAAAASVTMATVMPERIPQITVEIRDTAKRQLVSAIEILSPSNKQGSSRAEYIERRMRLLSSSAHLIEIDLLRRGLRVPMQKKLPSVPYFVFVGRANRRPMTEVWPITLRQPLPVVPVPLLRGDADVPLDLQRALRATYEGFAFDMDIDYRNPPAIPLPEEDAAWASERVAEWIKLRT